MNGSAVNVAEDISAKALLMTTATVIPVEDEFSENVPLNEFVENNTQPTILSLPHIKVQDENDSLQPVYDLEGSQQHVNNSESDVDHRGGFVAPILESNSPLPSIRSREGFDIESEFFQPLLPPDRGWGWAIVLASFMCNIMVDGVCFSYGIMLPHMSSSFVASESVLSMGGSVLTGCYLIMGPITSALANKFGCRSVTMIGSLIAFVAFVVSSLFIGNVYAFVFVFGVFGGIGFGLIYLPAMVIVGFWFEKRRAFATGIAVCGSGIGTLIFAPLTELLIQRFSWRGNIFVISAIILNCAVAGALFMPLDTYYNIRAIKRNKRYLKSQQDAAAAAAGKSVSGSKKPSAQKQSLIFKKILEEKKRQRNTSQGSLDGWLITGKNELIPEPDGYVDKPVLSNNAINSIVESVLNKNHGRSRNANSTSEQTSFRNKMPQFIKDYVNSLASLPADRVAVSAPDSEMPSACSSSCASHLSLDHLSQEATKQEIARQALKEINRPMNRKDVFCVSAGSLLHVPEYKSANNIQNYIHSVTSIPAEQQAGAPSCPMKSALQQMLDLHILLSPTFALLLLSSVCTMLGFFPVYMFLKNYAISHGIEEDKATWLISVIGLTNTIGRVVAVLYISEGAMSVRPWTNSLVINNLALILVGISTAALPFFHNYSAMVLYAVFFGLFIAAFVSLRSILVVELMGLERLTNAFGMLLLFQGFGIIAGPPLAALFGDSSSHYYYSFVLAGALLLSAGLLSLPLKSVCRWEKRRDEARKSAMGASSPSASLPRGRSRIQQQQTPVSTDTNGVIRSESHLSNVAVYEAVEAPVESVI